MHSCFKRSRKTPVTAPKVGAGRDREVSNSDRAKLGSAPQTPSHVSVRSVLIGSLATSQRPGARGALRTHAVKHVRTHARA
eukprot:5048989-Alexandrium_andersonii.AAC.1